MSACVHMAILVMVDSPRSIAPLAVSSNSNRVRPRQRKNPAVAGFFRHQVVFNGTRMPHYLITS